MALIFFSLHFSSAQEVPRLELDDGKLWLKDIDQEILYTFSRYYHDQQDWQSVFPVMTKQSDGITMQGRYDVYPTSISFTPRFPFAPGVAYVATFFTEGLAKNYNEVYLPEIRTGTLTLEFSIPAKKNSPPILTTIYPSSDVLPENLLKFHLSFSTPMKTGEVYQRVKLIDSRNKEVEKAFLIVDQELWDTEMKVVTLLLDPGRIKRGLRANLELSAPLKTGETYTLMVEAGWKSAGGIPLEHTVRKKFTCAPADRVSPQMANWELIAPKNTHDLLMLRSSETMDKILLSDGIRVTDDRGNKIEGTITVLSNESGIAFRPNQKWTHVTYLVNINPSLEDLAGNNFNRAFDKDLSDSTAQLIAEPKSFSFSFQAARQ
jgi:hypothetical protein